MRALSASAALLLVAANVPAFAKGPPPPPPKSAASQVSADAAGRAISELAGKFKFGMTPEEAMTLMEKDINAKFQPKIEAEKEAAAEKARLHAAAGPSAPSEFLPPQLEVTVQLPPALRVVGPELNTDLSGQLQLTRDTRDSDDLHITGEISTAAGWVEILSRRYQLERAQISLSGQVPPNPLLDVQIARKLDDATIYIQVTGSARKPVISFRSDPPIYDRSQIMTIILTGQGGSGSISQQAMGVLSSLVVDQLKSQLAGGLPIDVIKFDVAGADPLGLGQSSLEVGKYLRDDLYLGYMHRFGGATTGMRRLNIDQVRLEYRFLQKFQLTTVYGDANVGSIDLSWTKRF